MSDSENPYPLSDQARAMLSGLAAEAQLTEEKRHEQERANYFAETLPRSPSDPMGQEHIRYLTDAYLPRKTGTSALKLLIAAAQSDENRSASTLGVPDLIARPDSHYSPEQAALLKPYIRIAARPPRSSRRTIWTADEDPYIDTTVPRGPEDYLLRAGFVVDESERIAKDIIDGGSHRKMFHVGRTTAAALCQIAVSVQEIIQ